MTLLPIKLPQGAIVKVKEKDKVTKGKILATVSSIDSEIVIHLASDFSIPLKNFEKYLLKKPGDFVEEGGAIAFKKKFLGKTRILSKISGTVTKIDTDNGDLYIKAPSKTEEKGQDIISPVEGIVETCDNGKIVIKTEGDQIILKDAIGESASGVLLEIKDSETADKVENKILIIEEADRLFVYKSLSLGAKGVISLSLSDLDFLDLQGAKVGGAIALAEPEMFTKIKKLIGKEVAIDTENKSLTIL